VFIINIENNSVDKIENKTEIACAGLESKIVVSSNKIT
jgi:hypothetical protein